MIIPTFAFVSGSLISCWLSESNWFITIVALPAIVSSVFSKDLSNVGTHTAHFGRIRKGEEIIDEVLLTVLHEGKRFTG